MSEASKLITPQDVLKALETAEASKPEAAVEDDLDLTNEEVTETEEFAAAESEDEADEDVNEDEDQDDDDEDELQEWKQVLNKLPQELREQADVATWLKTLQQGADKIVTRAKEKEARLQPMMEWGSAFENPATVVDAFRDLGQKLSAFHKLDASQLFGAGASANEDVEDMEWESEGEALLAKKLKDMEARYATELEALRTEREKAKQEQEFKAQVAKVAKTTIKQIALEDSGWKVTEDQVAEAVKALPQFKPAQAVRMYHSDLRAKHMRRISVEESKLPLMPSSSRNTEGVKVPKPGKVSPEDVLRLRPFKGG